MQNVSFLPCRCLTIIACVFCVCVCRVCFPILFNPVCFCVIDLLSNPGHLARLPLWRVDHQHQRSQNFLYFQNQHQLRHWRGGVGGLREPCVAFYEPSQLHALVAAAGNKEERLDKILGGDVRTRSVEILNEKEGECVSLKSTLIIIWCGRE